MPIDTDGSVTAAYLFVVEHLSCAKRTCVAEAGSSCVTDEMLLVIATPFDTVIHTGCVYTGHETYCNVRIETDACVIAAYHFVAERSSCAKRTCVAEAGPCCVIDETLLVIATPFDTVIHTGCVYTGHEICCNFRIDIETCV